MRGRWPVRLVAFSVLVVTLAGCVTSAPRAPGTRSSGGSTTAPADTPLTGCVESTPATPNPIDTSLAHDFAAARVQAAVVLDDGVFRADPAPHDAAPRISAAVALCNLLAAATASNSSVLEAADQDGMSFGLGVVTVADSMLRTGTRTYLVGGEQRAASLQPYHHRLAWIAVIKPDLPAACPSRTPATNPAPKALPGYQILAIDANTGTAGIVYSAKTNAPCNLPGYQPASVAPAAEFVSLPWTLIKRGPGPQSASITYQPRPCDIPDRATFAGTGQPAAFADRDNPARVTIVRQRILTSCGPAATVPLLLRSSDLNTNLPEHLIHTPAGAEDVPPW